MRRLKNIQIQFLRNFQIQIQFQFQIQIQIQIQMIQIPILLQIQITGYWLLVTGFILFEGLIIQIQQRKR